MKNLKNKVAVITGAGAGIGRELALACADEGCHVAISDIDKKALRETEALVKNRDVRVFSEVLDVSNKKTMNEYPQKVCDKLGTVDIVINNAGVCALATVEEHSIEDYEWLMGVNFWGVLYGSKFFISHLRKETETYIVNISSVFGLVSMPNLSSYSAAKFAVRGFTESLRHELNDTNINVISVFPGGVKTDFSKKARFESTPGKSNHNEFNDIFEKYSMSTAESTAQKIIRGIKKSKKRIRIGPDAISGDYLLRLMPIRYDMFVRFICSKI